MANISKKQIVKELALNADIGTDAAASRTIETLITIIKREVAAGNSVDISGLGKFSSVERSGLVPNTTKQYTSIVPKFKASADFKRAVA